MQDTDEIHLLRTIATEDDGDAGYSVLADWLEEHGDGPRAEFIRVQCELAAKNRAEKRRHELRLRERALFDKHRHAWLQSYGLAMDDVRFERGLIAAMRPAAWENGELLKEEYASRLITLTELDLSGLGIGDDGLRAFAENADIPALRKLILSGNKLTKDGVAALAAAKGLPRLETVYLFQNELDDAARTILENADHFCPVNVDFGEHAEGYCMSPGETEVARRDFVRTQLWPLVNNQFQTHKRLQSAVLCVAQYWNDEANDAVHGNIVVSELFEPTLHVNVGYGDEYEDANLPNTRIQGRYGETGSVIGLWGHEVPWDDNYGAIPVWAAYAPEEGSQEYEHIDDVYAPAVMFYRHGGHVFLPLRRPQLDGVQPEFSE
jgi:uncharacterized protein (TIGR02996 family)